MSATVDTILFRDINTGEMYRIPADCEEAADRFLLLHDCGWIASSDFPVWLVHVPTHQLEQPMMPPGSEDYGREFIDKLLEDRP